MEEAPYDDPCHDESSVGMSGYSHEHPALSKEKREEIAERESRWVFCMRMIVLVVLLASACTMVGLIFATLSAQEVEEFESSFESAADVVFESVGRTFDQVLGSTDSFVGNLVSSNHESWPYVTMPHWGYHSAKLLKQSKGYNSGYCVLVKQEEIPAWLNFSQTNLEWVDEAKAVQATTDEDWADLDTEFQSPVLPFVWGVGAEGLEVYHEPTPFMNNYALTWQGYPVVEIEPGFPLNVNYDGWRVQLENNAETLLEAMTNATVIIKNGDNVLLNASDPMEAMVVEAAINYTQNFLTPGRGNASEPNGFILYPIFDSLDSLRLDRSAQDLKPLGYYWYTYFWRDYIQNILPEGSNGVLAVFKNSCGKPFTYRLDGPEPTYLGGGDLHDPKYDYLERSQTLHQLMDSTKQSAEGSSYTGLPLSDWYCPTTLSLYPSQDFEDDYNTQKPLTFTLCAALIFVFTSAVFIIYDCIVSRRQRVVMQRALASGAIVSSLFPEQVKQKLYEEKKQEQKAASLRQSNLEGFRSAMGGPTDIVPPGAPNNSGKPIADLFDETTIFFADLAGFTLWSSKRTPVEVFELLEKLYGAFDAIAKRRKVFKVETIGDCYVAVTGIPTPQKHHAVIMAKFARDCMADMHHLTRELADSLGEDTTTLEMRVGLHSGSTTAGVLRGEKGRFQLFGDTVNTASRMESNGMKGRIQVSQATADSLTESGKAHWLTPRADKIVAKGKGEMQTYWVNVISDATKTATTLSRKSSVRSSNQSSVRSGPAVDNDEDPSNFEDEEKDPTEVFLGGTDNEIRERTRV